MPDWQNPLSDGFWLARLQMRMSTSDYVTTTVQYLVPNLISCLMHQLIPLNLPNSLQYSGVWRAVCGLVC